MHTKLLDVFEDMLIINRYVIAKKRPRCSICGFRIRGENHENGEHHKRACAALIKAERTK